jgi:hypothetical protein
VKRLKSKMEKDACIHRLYQKHKLFPRVIGEGGGKPGKSTAEDARSTIHYLLFFLLTAHCSLLTVH